MIRKTIFLLIVYCLIIFSSPMLQTFDYDKGLTFNNIEGWAKEYILKSYDMSRIEEVNSHQTQNVEYFLGQSLTLEGHDVLQTEYEGEFRVIQQTDHFRMVLVNDGIVTGGYTNSSNIAFDSINIQGLYQKDIREIYGEPVTQLRRGMKRVNVDNDEYDVFDLGDRNVFFFYDVHMDYKVNGLLIFNKDEYSNFTELYNHPDHTDNERMLYYLVNATRGEYGYQILQQDSTIVEAARGHSRDMAIQGYFDHVSPDDVTLRDRLVANNVSFWFGGENIATGHTSPIFAHHSLLNSPDHRTNILHPEFTHLGTGVEYNSEDIPFYTENYVQR